MKEYVVKIEPSAESDIEESLIWGIENWGQEAAAEWFIDVHRMIHKKLAMLPFRYNLAPDTDLGHDIREMNIGRYRILFTVESKKVLVWRVRGPYVDE